MRKLRIGIIDLVTKAPTRALYARLMNANMASIMPQVVAVWCEEEGHEVTFVCYTGFEDLAAMLPENPDLVFIGAFSQAAQLSYAMSNFFRSRGAVTVLGGPHARCYPQDAQKYFDYVLGFTDKGVIRDLLQDCSPQRPYGIHLAAERQPADLPGVRERWKFIEPTLQKAPTIKIVPMLGSLGCPYTCSFCIDSVVPYQPLDFEVMKEDLRFLLQKFRRPRVAWHDPNFGIRFDDYMGAIEEAAPPGSIDFIAESSLSLLAEPHLKRLKRNGFKAILPGIESWYDLGNKSKTGKMTGMDKVRQVADHVNLILRYIPYIQTNFVLGLDVDEGPEPFELTKRFLDLAPGAFPGYSLLSAFGQAAPLNLEYQRANRVIPFPFHFLNNNHAMNVKPKNYAWPDFYDRVIDLTRYTFSLRAIYRRYRAIEETIPKWMNVVRAISSEGFGRIEYFTNLRRLLDTDRQLRSYFEQETTELPQFYIDRMRKELGAMWQWLPEGALHHDPNAYLNSQKAAAATPVSLITAENLPAEARAGGNGVLKTPAPARPAVRE
ncbi:MAG: radical SAM protein [Calditrichaceae bacterium]|nr:radical SAM protein [Calditrichia bacterium]NUQ43889.1 radical SAM protein [Calditrichaceae bacterium]